MHAEWIKTVVSWLPSYISPTGERSLWPAEEALIEASWMGKECIFSEEAPPETRAIRVEFLAWFLTHPRVRPYISASGVRIRSARLVNAAGHLGMLNLQGSHIRFPLELFTCQMATFHAPNATFRSLKLYECNITAEESLLPMKTNADVPEKLIETPPTQINLSHAYIDGTLDISRTICEGPLLLQGASIEGTLHLESAQIKKEINLIHTTIKGTLEGTRVECKNFLAEGLRAIGVKLSQASIEGTLDLTHARISSNLLCPRLQLYELSLRSATIGGDVNLEECALKEATGGVGFLKILQSIAELFSDLSLKSRIELYFAALANFLKLTSGKWMLPKGEEERKIHYEWDMEGVNIKGRLIIRKIDYGLERDKFLLNLQHSSIGMLEDDEESWPAAGNLLLHGIKVGSIHPNSPMEASRRIAWVRRQYPSIIGVSSFSTILLGGIGVLLYLALIAWGLFLLFSADFSGFKAIYNGDVNYKTILCIAVILWAMYLLLRYFKISPENTEFALIGPMVISNMPLILTYYSLTILFSNEMWKVMSKYYIIGFILYISISLITLLLTKKSTDKISLYGCLGGLSVLLLIGWYIFYPMYMEYQMYKHDMISIWTLLLLYILVPILSLVLLLLPQVVFAYLTVKKKATYTSHKYHYFLQWTVMILIVSYFFFPAMLYHFKKGYSINAQALLDALPYFVLALIATPSVFYLNNAADRRRYQKFEVKKETKSDDSAESGKEVESNKGKVFFTFYSPQPYEELAQFYRRIGRRDEVAAVKIAQNDDSIRYGPLIIGQDAWLLLLRYTTGYGYKLWYALLWAAFIVAAGSLIFEYAYKQNMITPASTDVLVSEEYQTSRKVPLDYPRFDPILYSLDVFIPIVDLKMEDFYLIERCYPSQQGTEPCKEHPMTPYLRWYLRFQIFMGWLLSTLIAAGLTGLIRSGEKDT